MMYHLEAWHSVMGWYRLRSSADPELLAARLRGHEATGGRSRLPWRIVDDQDDQDRPVALDAGREAHLGPERYGVIVNLTEIP